MPQKPLWWLFVQAFNFLVSLFVLVYLMTTYGTTPQQLPMAVAVTALLCMLNLVSMLVGAALAILVNLAKAKKLNLSGLIHLEPAEMALVWLGLIVGIAVVIITVVTDLRATAVFLVPTSVYLWLWLGKPPKPQKNDVSTIPST